MIFNIRYNYNCIIIVYIETVNNHFNADIIAPVEVSDVTTNRFVSECVYRCRIQTRVYYLGRNKFAHGKNKNISVSG